MTSLLGFTASLAFLLSHALASPLAGRASTPISEITPSQWRALNATVGGRLFSATPVAKPCYSYYNGVFTAPDLQQCTAVQNGYTTEDDIVANFGGYQYVSVQLVPC